MAKQGAGRPNPLANPNAGLAILGLIILGVVFIVCVCA